MSRDSARSAIQYAEESARIASGEYAAQDPHVGEVAVARGSIAIAETLFWIGDSLETVRNALTEISERFREVSSEDDFAREINVRSRS